MTESSLFDARTTCARKETWKRSLASMKISVKDKVHEFRERAERSRLKAAVTSEIAAKKMFEDAAQLWQDLAEKLEKYGRPY
jgi:hypothetical protein